MNHRHRTAAALFHATDDEIVEQFDALVLAATRGDRRAIGALAIALGTTLHDEARAALGPDGAQAAGDVVQDLMLGLVERRFAPPRVRGGALPWLKRTVRAIAAEVAFERGRGPDGNSRVFPGR